MQTVTVSHWQSRIGRQRDWIWRGWIIRYSFTLNSAENSISKPPIVLLHGFGASIEHWRHNISFLSQYSAVYALDLLGFGGSQKAATLYTLNLWVEQVYDFWRTVIGCPVVLVGNSIGSLVSLTAAATHPEMVQGLVMLSLPDVNARQEMLPKFVEPIVRRIENLFAVSGLLPLLFYFVRQPAIIRRWAGIAYENKTVVDDELVNILSAPAQEKDAEKAFNAIFRSVIRPDFARAVKDLLPHLDLPILLIWGQKDRMVPAFLAPQFARLNPQLQFIELKNVGHCPHDECPEIFNSHLLGWLTTHFG